MREMLSPMWVSLEITGHGNIDMTSRDNVSNGISGKVYGSVVSNGVSKLNLEANNASYYPNFTGTVSKMETGILMSVPNRDATETKQLQLKYPNYEKPIDNITEGTKRTISMNPQDIYLLKLSRTSHKMPTKTAQYTDDKNSGGSDQKSVLYPLKFPEISHKMADEKARYSDRDYESSGGSGLNSLLYPLKLSRASHKMADERTQHGNGDEKRSGGGEVNLVRRKRSFGLITLGALGVTALARKLFHHHHHHHDHHEHDHDHDHGHYDDHHHECHTFDCIPHGFVEEVYLHFREGRIENNLVKFTLSTTNLVLNPYLLVVGSPVQHKSDALHHVTTEAEPQLMQSQLHKGSICTFSYSSPMASLELIVSSQLTSDSQHLGTQAKPDSVRTRTKRQDLLIWFEYYGGTKVLIPTGIILNIPDQDTNLDLFINVDRGQGEFNYLDYWTIELWTKRSPMLPSNWRSGSANYADLVTIHGETREKVVRMAMWSQDLAKDRR
uniref:Uncharacterized protein n=1 Tax=Timema genevievae TaxID=629358 RepID=A0A7R9K6R4_TIMGE|nr:unnamed protein product [Timema genevievae]